MSAPMAALSRRYHLSASHRLHAAGLDDEANRATYGKCNHPHGHGHNYVVEVAFRGPVDASTGMVVDLAALDAFARVEVLDRFDCANLNCLELFAEIVPTTENVAVALHRIFSRFADSRSPHVRLERIHVEETGNNSFDYSGEITEFAGLTQ